MKKVIVAAFLILILPIIFLGGMLTSVVIHNKQLFDIKHQFDSLAHPANTKTIRMIYTVGGNVSGTGNQCDFFCCELRSYTGDKTSIQHYYKDQTLKLKGNKERVNVVFFGDETQDSADFYEMNEINTWVSNAELLNHHLYAIYIIDGGYNSLLDYRCY